MIDSPGAPAVILLAGVLSVFSSVSSAQPSLRTKIGQMIIVTVTGDSVEESSPSMDTMKADLADGLVGGIVMFTWSGNLRSPGQIAHLTAELQKRSRIPLLLAIDQEGGKVARLSAANGFAATSSAYELGTVLNEESATRLSAATMAGWFVETGLTMNLAPVVDLNINPSSPAIGALQRSFAAGASTVTRHAYWFIDEFHKRGVITTLKHFPGHGSATADSHLGFTDITDTWTATELEPYDSLLARGFVDAVMTGHLFHAALDPLYPATLSSATITGLLRTEIGYTGVVISDEMSMRAISDHFGLDQAAVLAVNAGVDILLYNRNRDSTGGSLARHMVELLEAEVARGRIAASRIDSSYDRIMALKGRLPTLVPLPVIAAAPQGPDLMNYPNPFNPTTTIVFGVPTAGRVLLTVVDLLGRSVETLVDDDREAGRYHVRFDAGGRAAGIYFLRLQTSAGSATRRLVSVK